MRGEDLAKGDLYASRYVSQLHEIRLVCKI